MALSRCFLRRTKLVDRIKNVGKDICGMYDVSSRAPLSRIELRALASCRWAGRCQTVRFDRQTPAVPSWLVSSLPSSSSSSSSPSPSSGRVLSPVHNRVRLHLDGAHTLKSTKSCIHWFDEVCRRRTVAPPARRRSDSPGLHAGERFFFKVKCSF